MISLEEIREFEAANTAREIAHTGDEEGKQTVDHRDGESGDYLDEDSLGVDSSRPLPLPSAPLPSLGESQEGSDASQSDGLFTALFLF